MIDTISTSSDLVIWILGLFLSVWIAIDARRVARTAMMGHPPSGQIVVTMRVAASIVAIGHAVQIVFPGRHSWRFEW
jgi:hypothetical protein